MDVLTRLSATTDVDLVENLKQAASQVVRAVPECVALSISHFDDDLTFTLVSTSDEMLIVDAAQYLDGGPCEAAATDGTDVYVGDILDEDRWQLFALAGAARGVRSSLSLPLRRGDRIYGSVNFYAATEYAFLGRERDLATMFGAGVQEAVANGDLSMSSLGRAKHAERVLEQRDKLNTAVGVLAVRQGVSPSEAHDNLIDAANRAGVPPLALAELVLRQRVT